MEIFIVCLSANILGMILGHIIYQIYDENKRNDV